MIHVNLQIHSLTLYTSSASDITSGQDFVEEIQQLHQRKKRKPMTVNKTHFSTEDVPEIAGITYGKGVIALPNALRVDVRRWMIKNNICYANGFKIDGVLNEFLDSYELLTRPNYRKFLYCCFRA